MPILFNVSGPYGVGKDTILNGIISRYPAIVHRVGTLTTRPVSLAADPSYEEVSFDEFERRITQGSWLVNYQLSGRVAYATSIDEIEDQARAGLICVHSIYPNPHGAGRLREIFGRKALSIGLLPARGRLATQLEELRKRLVVRGRDDPATVEARLKHQIQPLEYVIENPKVLTPDGIMEVFDIKVINEELERTIRHIVSLFRLKFLEDS